MSLGICFVFGRIKGNFLDMSEEEDDILKTTANRSKEGGGSMEEGGEGGKLGRESSKEIPKATYKESVLGSRGKNCLEEERSLDGWRNLE